MHFTMCNMNYTMFEYIFYACTRADTFVLTTVADNQAAIDLSYISLQ